MDSATSCSARCSPSHWMASFSRATGSTVSRSWTFWAVVRNGEYPELSASAEMSSICWTRSTTCQAPRFFSQLVASALYSLTRLGGRTGQRVGHGGVEHGPLDPERPAGTTGPGPDADPVAGPDERARVAVAQASDLLDGPEDTRPRVRPVDPRHQQHLGLAAAGAGGGLRGLDGGAHLGVGQVQRHHHAGQDDLVVQRQHGQVDRCERLGLGSHDLPFGRQVELCGLNACEPPNVPRAVFAVSDQPVPGHRSPPPSGIPVHGSVRRGTAIPGHPAPEPFPARVREWPGRRSSPGRRTPCRSSAGRDPGRPVWSRTPGRGPRCRSGCRPGAWRWCCSRAGTRGCSRPSPSGGRTRQWPGAQLHPGR